MKTEKSILIGKNLRKARECKGLTQLEVMKLRGYESTSTVSSHESGERTPKAIELYELSKLYEVSMDFLHGDDVREKGLTDEEKQLLENFRKASNKDKEVAKAILTPEEEKVLSFSS